MIIQWLGMSCFKLQTKSQQGESVVVTDPFSDSTGLKMSKFQADIVTCSLNQENHNNIEAIRGEPFVITNPGEYETRGVFVYGFPIVLEKEKIAPTVFKIFSEEISIVHLSELSQVLTDEQVDRLGNVDILFLPVGNPKLLDTKKAVEIITQLDPRIVIPMNFRVEGQKSNLETADDFIKHCGLKNETLDKLKISKKDLMAEETRVITLTV